MELIYLVKHNSSNKIKHKIISLFYTYMRVTQRKNLCVTRLVQCSPIHCILPLLNNPII